MTMEVKKQVILKASWQNTEKAVNFSKKALIGFGFHEPYIVSGGMYGLIYEAYIYIYIDFELI